MTRLVLVVVLAACTARTSANPKASLGAAAVRGEGAASIAARSAAPGRATPAPLPALPGGVPPGGAMRAVAVTERGDAALSLDELGGVRLWPTLDGTRPPIAIPADAPAAVALSRDGDALISAVLDQAGGVTLWRVTEDGALRGRAQLPDGGAYTRVVAIDGGVLAVRRDESIERYDARGARRGRIAADAGERIDAVAVRRGRAIALVSREGASAVRWITLGDGLAWGARVALPLPAAPDALALAPTLARIAVVQASTHVLVALDLVPAAHELRRVTTEAQPGPEAIGFADDATLVATDALAGVWRVSGGTAPADLALRRAPGAIADGRVVLADVAELDLIDTATGRTRYLGWSQLALAGFVSAMGSGVVLEQGDNGGMRLSWLDASLARTRTYVAPQGSEVLPVDDRHVLVHPVEVAALPLMRVGAKPPRPRVASDRRLALVDLAAPDAPVPLPIAAPPSAALVYRAELGILAIADAGELVRYRLDVAHGRATALPAIAVHGISGVELLDPSRAGGAIASEAHGVAHHGGEIAVDYIDEHGARSTSPPAEGAVIASDASGVVAVRAGPAIVELQGGRELVRFTVGDGENGAAALSHADRLLALVDGCIVSVYDARGQQRWRRALCGAGSVAFTADGRALVASTSGGVVALDAATGDTVATACGWDFGLHDDPPADLDTLAQPVCGG